MIVELDPMKRNDAGNTHRINLGLGTHKAGGVKAEATEELATTEGHGGPGHPVLLGEDGHLGRATISDDDANDLGS
jgi:hypothetical protein